MFTVLSRSLTRCPEIWNDHCYPTGAASLQSTAPKEVPPTHTQTKALSVQPSGRKILLFQIRRDVRMEPCPVQYQYRIRILLCELHVLVKPPRLLVKLRLPDV